MFVPRGLTPVAEDDRVVAGAVTPSALRAIDGGCLLTTASTLATAANSGGGRDKSRWGFEDSTSPAGASRLEDVTK